MKFAVADAMDGELSHALKHFFSIPRPSGGTLKMIINKRSYFENEDEHPIPYHAILDFLINGNTLAIRANILNGDMINQRILIKLGKINQYYIYHPLLGLNAVSRIQMEKQLTRVGFDLNTLLITLDPLRGTQRSQWLSKTKDKGFIIFSAANKLGCRDEYHFSSFNLLPDFIWYCQGSIKQTLKIELSGTTKLRSFILPKQVRFIKNNHLVSEIQLQPTLMNNWQNADIYTKEKLTQILHPTTMP